MKLWIRVGDHGDYSDFNSLPEVVTFLFEAGVRSEELARRSGGITAVGFTRNNYVSLYWGDPSGNLDRELDPFEFAFVRYAIELEQVRATFGTPVTAEPLFDSDTVSKFLESLRLFCSVRKAFESVWVSATGRTEGVLAVWEAANLLFEDSGGTIGDPKLGNPLVGSVLRVLVDLER